MVYQRLKPDRLQLVSVSFKPLLALVRIRTEFVAKCPKIGRMVHLFEMRDLMGDQIIDHPGRRHHDAPGER